MRDTIEQLALSKRGRGNIISYCYESKWDLSETERKEVNLGEIYDMTMKMPQHIRPRIFDWSHEIYEIMNQYVLEKGKEAVSLIIPGFPIHDLSKVFCESYFNLRFSKQANSELEKIRREMVFAQAVNAFLRHL